MAEILQYKCPCCGGKIEFDSSIQKMKCPYCDTEFDMETLKDYDEVLQEETPDEMSWDTQAGSAWQEGEEDGMRVYVCNSCGGQVITDATTAATQCPYCGNPMVMASQFAGDLRPDYVIPFRLDLKAAKEAMKRHLLKKRLLPKAFKTQNHIDEIKGVYVPFWLFDADADASINYRASRVRVWSDSKYDYTETSYFAVYRAGRLGFERVPVDGSAKMPDDLMESIEPFDFSGAVDFQTAYLSGYLADRYDVSAEESISRANGRIKTSTEQTFLSTVQGYSSVAVQNSSIHLNNGKAKYALYPVWLLNTTWRGEKYIFAMNGQTGKFVGNLPVDRGAWWRWFALFTGIFGAAFYLLRWLLWLL